MTVCAYSFKKYTCFKENYFSLKLFWIFSFKIYSITLDPDPNSMYLDPQHCYYNNILSFNWLLLMRKSYNYEVILFFYIVLRNSLDPDSRSSGSGLRFFTGSGFKCIPVPIRNTACRAWNLPVLIRWFSRKNVCDQWLFADRTGSALKPLLKAG